MMYLMSLDKKAGFKGMDYCVPKFVAKSNVFARNCQREYCRQELYFLNDAIDKAKKSLATAKSQNDTNGITKAELKLNELDNQRSDLRNMTIAAIMFYDLDTEYKTKEELEKATDAEKKEQSAKIIEAADLLPLWLARTDDIIASTYVCVMFGFKTMPAMTGFKDLYNSVNDYNSRYHTEEKTSDNQIKDFRALKTDCEKSLNLVFEVSGNDTYKNYKVSKLPTYVVNDFASATKGVYKATKSGGVKLNPLKEDVAKRQLILAFLHWQGCADTDKAPVLTTLENMGDMSF